MRLARALAYLEVPRALAGLGLFLVLWALPDLRPARSEEELLARDDRRALALLAAGAEALEMGAAIALATGLERSRRWARPLLLAYGLFDAAWHLAYAHAAGLAPGWLGRLWLGWAVALGVGAVLAFATSRPIRPA